MTNTTSHAQAMTMKAMSFPRKRESTTTQVSTVGFSLDARLRGQDGYDSVCTGMTDMTPSARA
ncbi:MAG TPA: hypothetical protein VGK87_16020 [Anaerolineae bacterium]|jgi:hypothetical protein